MNSQAISSMPDKNPQTKPLWTCPRCGHRFVSPNMAHSCLQVELSTHFAGKDKRIRKLFDAWLAFVRKFGGPVTVNSQKSQITFQARIRFAGATVRRQWVECGFWLKRPDGHAFPQGGKDPASQLHILFQAHQPSPTR